MRLVSTGGLSLDALPEGARVGTSSLRRRCQLLALRPDLDVRDLRGGVDTRLRQLDEGHYDAIVLACAGLIRMELRERIGEAIDPGRFIPAVGQGVVAIECREADADTQALIEPLNHDVSALQARSERALNEALEGGCQVPIAAHANLHGDELKMAALVASPDGAQVLRESGSCARDEGEALGRTLAQALLDRGARAILDAVYAEA